jgi:hypothetical protein
VENTEHQNFIAVPSFNKAALRTSNDVTSSVLFIG